MCVGVCCISVSVYVRCISVSVCVCGLYFCECVCVCYLRGRPGGALTDSRHTKAEALSAALRVAALQVEEALLTQVTMGPHHVLLEHTHTHTQHSQEGNTELILCVCVCQAFQNINILYTNAYMHIHTQISLL